MNNKAVVTLADSTYFEMLIELINSITRFEQSSNVDICVLDAGLSDIQLSKLSDKVKKIIAEHLGIDDMSKITDEAKFIDDLGADSLDTVELVMAFEEAFDVEIPDEKAETILTVGDAISHLES